MSPHMAKGGIERLRQKRHALWGMPFLHGQAVIVRLRLSSSAAAFPFPPGWRRGSGCLPRTGMTSTGCVLGCADKSPAVSEVHPRTVEFDGIVEIAEMFLDPFHYGELDSVGAGDVDFRRGKGGRPSRQLRHGLFLRGEQSGHSGGSVDGVVEAVPVFGEEHVAGHFSGKGGVHFVHARLDEGVPGGPHHGYAAMSFNVGEKTA